MVKVDGCGGFRDQGLGFRGLRIRVYVLRITRAK